MRGAGKNCFPTGGVMWLMRGAGLFFDYLIHRATIKGAFLMQK
jgi:hypothetical protein